MLLSKYLSKNVSILRRKHTVIDEFMTRRLDMDSITQKKQFGVS